METLLNFFGAMLLFTYHCFDRMVISGYLSSISRPDQIVYFFREICGIRRITKEILSQRTFDYQKWVEGYALNHEIPIEWAEKGVRKEESVRPHLGAMQRRDEYGVYYIYKSMEQGPAFRSVKPKYPTSDPDHQIITKMRSRFTHYYFYIRDEHLGSLAIRVASFFPFGVTCYLNGHNFIEQELNRCGEKFTKNDNAILSAKNPQAIQEAADRLSSELIRERLDHWVFMLGPKFSQREREKMNLRRFWSVTQIEYCQNFIFRRNFPIRRLFERTCELGLIRLTADKISGIFGWRITKKFNGKLQNILERADQCHQVLRAYFKNSFVKQYEKFRTFLRMEVCVNNLYDLRLKKSIDKLDLVREASRKVLDRFASAQSQIYKVHFDFPLFERMAQPVNQANTRISGIKIHDTRMIRLMEMLLNLGSSIFGFTSKQIHQCVVERYEQPDYTINQLRYDLRKMKAHGLVERNGKRYTYRLTDKGVKTALLFILFHKRLCGPLANSIFANRSVMIKSTYDSKLETAYNNADNSIRKIVDLLAA